MDLGDGLLDRPVPPNQVLPKGNEVSEVKDLAATFKSSAANRPQNATTRTKEAPTAAEVAALTALLKGKK